MSLLDLLLPPSCAGCGRYGQTICEVCRAELRPPVADADRLFASDPGIVIGDALTLGVAAFAHRDAAVRILRRLKYGGGRRLAAPLTDMALPAFQRLVEMTGRPAVVVPVPIHKTRLGERGYNQAELLAVELAHRADVPVWRALTRQRATDRQHGLDRATRLRNLQSAMALGTVPPPGGYLGDRAVVLVDDILTTGATLESCASVLRAAGCPTVFGFAIAREV